MTNGNHRVQPMPPYNPPKNWIGLGIAIAVVTIVVIALYWSGIRITDFLP